MMNSRKVSRGDLRVIFSNIEFIRDFHTNLLKVLETLMTGTESLTLRSVSVGKLLFAMVRSPSGLFVMSRGLF